MTILLCMILILFLNLKLSLGRSRRCLSVWKALKPSKVVAPFSEEMFNPFTWALINKDKLNSAFVLMLSCNGCLRVSEAIKLTWHDVALPRDFRLSYYGRETAGVNIWDAKKSQNTGRLQFVPIRNRYCIQLMTEVYNQSTKRGPAVQVRYKDYLNDIKLTCCDFGLPTR